MPHDKVAILDAGAQYGKLIDRAIRELCVESDILPMDTPLSNLLKQDKDSGNLYKAIIISGGPGSVNDSHSCVCDPSIFEAYLNPSQNNLVQPLPILGICYGFQYINHVFNGVIEAMSTREDGVFQIKLDTSSQLYKGLEVQQNVLLTHGDSLVELGRGLKSNAVSGDLIVGLEHERHKVYGVQYHLEVDLTPCGKRVLKNFLYQIAGCTPAFTLPNRELSCLHDIRSRVKDGKVLLLLSGGVDSCTCAALLRKCLKPDQIIAIHIDNGFMRKNESSEIELSMKKYGLPLKVINATNRFVQYPLPYLEFLDPSIGKPPCPCCRCVNSPCGDKGDHHLAQSRKSPSDKRDADPAGGKCCASCADTRQHCACCLCPSEAAQKSDDQATHVNKTLKMDTDRSPARPPSTANGHVEDHHHSALAGSKSTTSPCCSCSSTGAVSAQEPRRRFTRSMSRSMEENLIKSGFVVHCFRNYDGEIMFRPLCRIVDPEIKRRIIGDVFVQVADDVIAELKLDPAEVYFCQGTLRPDLIESASHLASGKADLIKTHHNDTKLMRMLRAQGRVIEPLKDFHKDEVRSLAKDLQLPPDIIHRHPFPGPGLAIRIICAVEPFMDKTFTETNFILKLLVQIVPEEYQKICHSTTIVQKLKDSLSTADKAKLVEILTHNNRAIRYSAILLPIKTVGVQGDKRSYSYVCALSFSKTANPILVPKVAPPGTETKMEVCPNSSVPTTDLPPHHVADSGAMGGSAGGAGSGCKGEETFDNIPLSASVNWAHLFALAQIIPKVCHNVNRVVFVYGPEYKYPITEIVPTYINNLTLGMLRQADNIAHTILKRSGHYNDISQMPVILVPIQFDRSFDCTGQVPILYSEVVRPPAGTKIFPAPEPAVVSTVNGPSVGAVRSGSGSSTTNTTWPYSNDDPVLRSVVLRPFISSDFMTGLAAVPGKHIPFEVLDEMVLQLSTQVQGISRVLLDLTSKPPGTTEWE